MDHSMPGFHVLHHLPEFAQTHAHLILCCPFLLLISIFPSIRVFFNGSSHQVDKVLELKLQHKSFQHIFRVSFRIDLFYLLAVQGTLKNLL